MGVPGITLSCVLKGHGRTSSGGLLHAITPCFWPLGTPLPIETRDVSIQRFFFFKLWMFYPQVSTLHSHDQTTRSNLTIECFLWQILLTELLFVFSMVINYRWVCKTHPEQGLILGLFLGPQPYRTLVETCSWNQMQGWEYPIFIVPPLCIFKKR